MHKIVMPALGQTTDELRIVAWRKAEGDDVALGELLFEVETDKTCIEVESAFAGTLIKIVHGPDAIVHTGSVIAYIGVPGEVIPSDEIERPQEAQAPGTIAASHSSVATAPSPHTVPAGKVLATPAARQLAREHGLDLNTIRGSGPDGRIEKEDVQAAIGHT
jgi:pyruvate dehydrogenase E2 component (dihydrolipoamide acetyltransferase)